MTEKEALKSALETMESFQSRTNGLYEGEFQEEINAIKEVLAQPEQKRPQNCGTSYCSCIECVMEPDYKALWEQMCERCDELDKKLAQQEHLEPVAWMSKDADIVYASIQVDGCFHNDHIPLYTTPPQRTWVGLSVFEINDLVENTEYEDYRDLIERTEDKLKEKNT